ARPSATWASPARNCWVCPSRIWPGQALQDPWNDKPMRAVDLIRRKRDGEALTSKELDWFCSRAGRSELPDYQISAFLMATWFKGMSPEETAALTAGMVHSGDVVDLSDLDGIKVD